MTMELMSLLAGGVSGFVMKLIAYQVQSQQELFKQQMAWIPVADESADRASRRGGVVMRRFIVVSIMLGVVYFPLVMAFTGVDTVVETNPASWDILGIFTGGFESIEGYLVMGEVRSAVMAIIGFYFGQGTIRS